MLDALKKGLSVLAVLSVVSCGGGSGDTYITGIDKVTGGGSDSTSSKTTTTTNPACTNTSTTIAAGTTTDTADTTDTTGTTGTTSTGCTTTDTSTIDERIADLEVAASSRQLGSNGGQPVIISAVVKDINNNTLKDVSVQFAVDNNGTIEPDADTVDSGVKTAKLTPGLNRPENRTLTVTVTAGTQERTINVDVTGTTVQLDGPERIVINTPTQFVAKLKDSTGIGLPYQMLDVQSANGNVIGTTNNLGFTTDNDGQVAFTLSASGSGEDTLTVSALGATYAHTVSISGDEFVLSSDKQEITVDANEEISLLWERDGAPQASKEIKLTATRGTVPASVMTDEQGKAGFSISSSSAGGTVITAVDAETGLTASMSLEFVAITPKYLIVQSDRANIGPEEQTTVFALVRDEFDNPVKNQKVTFNLYDSVDGKLSSSIATTDSLGRASIVYTAGNAASSKDGVTIHAALQSNGAITGKLHITVGKRALRIVLGDDEKLEDIGVFYQKSYGVIVTDSAGNPVAGKTVDFSLIPTHYFKGHMVCTTDNKWALAESVVSCPSEDVDNDGRMDFGEDYNNNGLLDPTHTATVSNTATTDEEGKATVRVTYPQSHALWSRVRLVAKVSDEGSEYYETAEFVLPVLVTDVSSCDVSPPNARSPYGIEIPCESPH